MDRIKKSVQICNVSRETFIEATTLFNEKRETFDRLLTYWLDWNKKINLFSKNINPVLLEKHVIHSLLLSLISDVSEYNVVIDAGTGGGLPGIPLAMVDNGMPYYLVDKNKKKCLAIRDILRTLETRNTRIYHSDIASVKINGSIRLVSKHAFPVNKLVQATRHLNWVELAMLKGGDIYSELNENMVKHHSIIFHQFINFGDPFFENKGLLIVHRSP